MLTFEALNENFTFLLLEVLAQVEDTQEYLMNPKDQLKEQIKNRLDKTFNFQNVVETKCYSEMHAAHSLTRNSVARLRAYHLMATHLHMIADFCEGIVDQVQYLTKHSKLDPDEYIPFFDDIKHALHLIQPTMDDGSLNMALRIARTEYLLDKKYEKVFARILKELNSGKRAAAHITVIFIYRYLERIGDSLERIGAALISTTIGNTLNPSQYESLKKTLNDSGFTGSMSQIDYRAILGSRSGCRIGIIESMYPSTKTGRKDSIYKEGSRAKIQQEKLNIELWQSLFPSLVPNIYAYDEGDENASLLLELLTGRTFDELILEEEAETVDTGIQTLFATIRYVWERTKQKTPISTNYIHQLSCRLSPIMQVHPASKRSSHSVGGVTTFSTEELLTKCSVLEKEMVAPFSVLIHGDFNTNNIIYNIQNDTIRYIDLYRSRQFDYLQDASVFLVSLFRLPIFDPHLRDRLNYVTEQFYTFIKTFAADHGDVTFASRLTLALARSFYTSTRFELNQSFAKRMYMRSHYLMEKLLEHPEENWEEFIFPEDIIYY